MEEQRPDGAGTKPDEESEILSCGKSVFNPLEKQSSRFDRARVTRCFDSRMLSEDGQAHALDP
jgi:hypothetical protein